MSIWTWHGTGSNGEFKTADLYADSEQQARKLVEQMGVKIMSLNPKGSPPEKLAPVEMPKPNPISAEAQNRVASTIDAMSRHVDSEKKTAPQASAPAVTHGKQRIMHGPLDKVASDANGILASGGKVISMTVHPSMTGAMQLVVLIEE